MLYFICFLSVRKLTLLHSNYITLFQVLLYLVATEYVFPFYYSFRSFTLQLNCHSKKRTTRSKEFVRWQACFKLVGLYLLQASMLLFPFFFLSHLYFSIIKQPMSPVQLCAQHWHLWNSKCRNPISFKGKQTELKRKMD